MPKGTSLSAVGADEQNLYVTLNSGGIGELLALDSRSWNIRWQRQFAMECAVPPVGCGGDLIVTDFGANVYCLDGFQGAERWRWKGAALKQLSEPDWQTGERTESPTQSLSKPTIAGDSLFFSHAMSGCYRLQRATGAVVWEVPQQASLEFPAVVAGRLVFVPDTSGNLFALHVDSDDIAWRRYVGHTWVSSPEVVDDVAYVASAPTFRGPREASLTALDLGSGRILWRSDVEMTEMDSPRLLRGEIFLSGGLYSRRDGHLMMDLGGLGSFAATPVKDGMLLQYGGDIVFVR